MSENLLSIYLDEYPDETPWDALKYLIAGINYGGHVTDDADRRLLLTYINDYFTEDAINVPFFKSVFILYSFSIYSIVFSLLSHELVSPFGMLETSHHFEVQLQH